MGPTLRLDGTDLTLDQFVGLANGPVDVVVSEEVRARLSEARSIIDRYLAGGLPVYGLNTGLGANLGHRLDPAKIPAFQAQLLRGRMVGAGEPLAPEVSRAALIARLIGASKGGAGLSEVIFDAMVTLVRAGVAPVLPS
ncbi:MAG: aromatic amino acid lyase, partial [Pseudomonadota bacterium]